MLYHYLAADKTGTLIEGEREAETVADIVRFLASSGYQPVAVEKIGKETGIQLFQGHINAQDKVFLVKYLALMMKVGTDLLSAINILIADFEKRAVKDFLLEVREGLSQGHPFYEAFARHTEIFSPVFVNLIKAAETSGNLEQTFEELAESLERDAEILSKAKSAMIYPAILMVAGLGLFTFLSTFAIPKIAKVFLDSGIEPPFISRIVFGAGLLVNDHLILFILSIVGGAFGFWYLFFKNRLGRVVRDRVVRRLPLVSAVVRDLAVQRFTGTLSSLLRAGLPIVDAIKITADVVGLDEFAQALRRVAEEGIARGVSIGDAFKRETVFPRMVTNLIAISEKAGHVEEVLQTLSTFYATSVERSIKNLVALLEPFMLLLMGFMVGGIAMAVILPIYQLTSQV